MNLSNVKTNLFAACVCILALTSCTDYGKKVTFTDNKGEVFYKGDGVTEADAKAVGNFLAEKGFFMKDDKKRSVQITKDGGRIKARFVIDEKGLATVKDADANFEMIGAMMSKSVFNNIPVDIIYTDDTFKDKKTIAYNAAALGQVNALEETKNMQRKDHINNTLFFYQKDFTEADLNSLFDYLVKSGLFSDDGNNDLIVTKTDAGAYHFRFPVKKSFANDEGYQKVDAFVKQLKQDMFANVGLEFEVMDENMQHLKTFTY